MRIFLVKNVRTKKVTAIKYSVKMQKKLWKCSNDGCHTTIGVWLSSFEYFATCSVYFFAFLKF